MPRRLAGRNPVVGPPVGAGRGPSQPRRERYDAEGRRGPVGQQQLALLGGVDAVRLQQPWPVQVIPRDDRRTTGGDRRVGLSARRRMPLPPPGNPASARLTVAATTRSAASPSAATIGLSRAAYASASQSNSTSLVPMLRQATSYRSPASDNSCSSTSSVRAPLAEMRRTSAPIARPSQAAHESSAWTMLSPTATSVTRQRPRARTASSPAPSRGSGARRRMCRPS